jgi:hypothetical protein
MYFNRTTGYCYRVVTYKASHARLVNNFTNNFYSLYFEKTSDAFRTLKGASSVRMLITTLTSLVLIQTNPDSNELS